MDDAVGTMAICASGPPARLTNAERISLSRSLSSAPPMAITGPAVTAPLGDVGPGSVAVRVCVALPATVINPVFAAFQAYPGNVSRHYGTGARPHAVAICVRSVHGCPLELGVASISSHHYSSVRDALGLTYSACFAEGMEEPGGTQVDEKR